MRSILVTGGTGSFGQAFIKRALEQRHQVDVTHYRSEVVPETIPSDDFVYDRVIVFSRDELKQSQMREAGLTDERLRYFIGDVRDRDRLDVALEGVDVVVHAAAMKQVDTCEYNPLEAVKTNVYGTENLIWACRRAGVKRCLMVGTDKAVDPVNLYGATKLAAEKLMIDANGSLAGTRFSCTRYGNVLTSRGSVLNRFLAQRAAGRPLTITDPTMTRFVLTLQQAVDFVGGCLHRMQGGEVFVPRLSTVDVETIAEAVWPWHGGRVEIVVGRRPGEKNNELLISQNEPELAAANKLPFPYGSDTDPDDRLSVEGFRAMVSMPDGVPV